MIAFYGKATAGRPLQKAARAPPAARRGTQRLRGRETTLAEAEALALRRDDLRGFRSKRDGKAPAPTGWMAPGRQECRRRKSPPEGQGDEGQSSGDQMIGKSPEGL